MGRHEQFILCRRLYVAESDATARAIVEPALHYFFTVFNRGFNEAINQAAADQQTLLAQLTSARSFTYFSRGEPRSDRFLAIELGRSQASRYLIAGNPDTVARQIKRRCSTSAPVTSWVCSISAILRMTTSSIRLISHKGSSCRGFAKARNAL